MTPGIPKALGGANAIRDRQPRFGASACRLENCAGSHPDPYPPADSGEANPNRSVARRSRHANLLVERAAAPNACRSRFPRPPPAPANGKLVRCSEWRPNCSRGQAGGSPAGSKKILARKNLEATKHLMAGLDL